MTAVAGVVCFVSQQNKIILEYARTENMQGETMRRILSVRVEHDVASGGRKLVASKGVSTGDVVLHLAPDAAVLSDEQAARRCHDSFLPSDSLMRCGKCKFARYSSRSAQKNAWTLGGQQECAALLACSPRVPPPTIRLVAQIIWRSALKRNSAPVFPGTPNVDGLLSHWEDLADWQKLRYAQMATVTLDFMQGGGASDGIGLPSAKEVAMMLARVACNCMTICDEELNPIGTGLYLTAAMANHSCNPSCAQTFNGSELKLRALRPLSEGEEVTIAYIEMAATRQERRLTLQESYFFDIDEYGSVPGPLPVVRAGCQEQGSASSNSPGSAMNTMELATGITVCLLSEQEAGFRSDTVDSELTQMCGLSGSLKMHGRLAADKPPEESTWAEFDGMHSDVRTEGLTASIAGNDHSQAKRMASSVADAVDQQVMSDAEGIDLDPAGRVELYCHGATSSDIDMVRQAANMISQMLREHHKLEILLKQSKFQEAMENGLRVLELGDSPGHVSLGPMHILRVRMMQTIERAAIESANWEVATQAAKELSPLLDRIYPQLSPVRGLQLASWAKLAALKEGSLPATQEAIHAAEKALDILQITHGRSAGLVREMENLRDQLRMELPYLRQ